MKRYCPHTLLAIPADVVGHYKKDITINED